MGKTKRGRGWGQTGVLTRSDLWSSIQAGYEDGQDWEDGVSGRQSQVLRFSSEGFQKALPSPPLSPARLWATLPVSSTASGKDVNQGGGGKYISSSAVTAIINVCTSKQLRLPQCQNQQPATPDSAAQRIITRDGISDPMKCVCNSQA